MPLETIGTKLRNGDVLTLQKMIFIYNALENGWTIKKLEGEKFEFTRDLKDEHEKEEVNLGDYLKRFLLYNFTIG